jgi:Gpi18-like mannosyltransferase
MESAYSDEKPRLRLLRRLKTASKVIARYQPHSYMSYLSVFLIFVSSRLLILLAIAFSSSFIPQKDGSEYWNISTAWYRYLLRYDSGWYLKIMWDGYTYNNDDLSQSSVVFYPLYPMIAQFLSIVLDMDQAIAILLVSNTSIIIAIFLLFKMVKDEYDREVALYSISLISFFPTSLFFSSGYTESLALLLIVTFFLFLKREWYFSAAICAGLASATRSTGIVLLPPLLFELVRQSDRGRKWLAIHAIICTGLATSGLWLYITYLWFTFNTPWAFLTAQRAWSSGNEVGSNFLSLITLQPFFRLVDIFVVGPQTYALDPWFFLFFLLLLTLFGKKLRISYRLFGLGTLLLPYFTLTGSRGFVSFMRYALLAFPVFIIIADMLRQSLWLRVCVTAFFAALLFMYTALFAQWHWAG